MSISSFMCDEIFVYQYTQLKNLHGNRINTVELVREPVACNIQQSSASPDTLGDTRSERKVFTVRFDENPNLTRRNVLMVSKWNGSEYPVLGPASPGPGLLWGFPSLGFGIGGLGFGQPEQEQAMNLAFVMKINGLSEFGPPGCAELWQVDAELTTAQAITLNV